MCEFALYRWLGVDSFVIYMMGVCGLTRRLVRTVGVQTELLASAD
jgi:hypothetical protein